MKKLMFLMCGLLMCAALSYAQGPARGPDKANTEDAKMEADARHELEVARQYFKLRKAYVAALSRAEEIVAGYPTFSKRDEALYIAGMSSIYLANGKGKQKSPAKPEDLRAQAREFLSEIVNSFPDSDFRKEAEENLKDLGGPLKPPSEKAHATRADAQPLMYGLVVDCTGSMRSRLGEMVAVGKAFVQGMGEKDEAFIVKFVSSDKIELVEAPTANKAWLGQSLDDLYVQGGKSAVLDGVFFAVKYLTEERSKKLAQGRRALILISDGDDKGSQHSQEALLTLLKDEKISVYVAGFKAEENARKAAALLTTLATKTGGKSYIAKSEAELVKAVPEILAAIRQQNATPQGEK